MGVLIFYGFVYTPVISYVSARMEGIVGMSVNVPFVREATFILTGYKGAAIWFAPVSGIQLRGPDQLLPPDRTDRHENHVSMVKAELFVLPIVILSTVLFSQFIWRIAPVPSTRLPVRQPVLGADQLPVSALFMSSTLPGGEHGPFYEAFHWSYLFCRAGHRPGASTPC